MRPTAFRRVVSTALLFILGLSAAGCDRKHEGAINATVIGESLELVDPAAGSLTEPQAVLLANVAQGLVRFDARGQVVPGLAERWNVTDDGLSYIFRLAPGQWPNGDKITAHQIARILRRQIAARSSNPLKDTLGAVDEIVAMTERVIEIRLTSPRPNLLQVLAQPELAIVRDGQGTGPFRIADGKEGAGRLRLVRDVPGPDGEESRAEEVMLGAAQAPAAVQQFARGESDLVLGGTAADLPYARAEGVSTRALRFDPAAGLFGLVPARAEGPLADEELRRLLSQAIDRQALLTSFAVPGLLPRATLLEPGLDGVEDPIPPDWAALPIAERRASLAAAANRLFAGDQERPLLRIAVPGGPGGDLLLQHLDQAWSVLGIRVERAGPGRGADLRLIDSVAPSSSPAWYLRQFRCGEVPICSEEADELLEAARTAPVAAQRFALLAEAARRMENAQLFLPIAAPIRWSLVSTDVQGVAPNRFARHPLTALTEQLNPERAE